MGKVFADISMSVDGFIAGPKPTLKDPLGQGGERLHDWVVKLAAWRKSHGKPGGEINSNSAIMEEVLARTGGAVIMGRKMYSNGKGSWEDDPKADGWWGDNPPFHCPVFVLTHHGRKPLQKQGGTTFIFVTDGVESALSQAKATARGKDISIAGGANIIQQFIKAGHVDDLQIHLVPTLLGGGTRLLENLGNAKLEKIRVVDSPEVTHIKFKIKK